VKGPPNIDGLIEAEDVTSELARELMIDRFGPSCAAWLVNRFRRMIHRYGAFRVHLDPKEEVPPWFGIAIQFLARREGWDTARARDAKGNRSWIVRWTKQPARRGAAIFMSPGGRG
jgi:hypothetical protein